MIDSEQVPRGKGEKQPGEGDEIVSETVCLQRAGDLTTSRFARCGISNSPNYLIHLIKYQYYSQKNFDFDIGIFIRN